MSQPTLTPRRQTPAAAHRPARASHSRSLPANKVSCARYPFASFSDHPCQVSCSPFFPLSARFISRFQAGSWTIALIVGHAVRCLSCRCGSTFGDLRPQSVIPSVLSTRTPTETLRMSPQRTIRVLPQHDERHSHLPPDLIINQTHAPAKLHDSSRCAPPVRAA